VVAQHREVDEAKPKPVPPAHEALADAQKAPARSQVPHVRQYAPRHVHRMARGQHGPFAVRHLPQRPPAFLRPAARPLSLPAPHRQLQRQLLRLPHPRPLPPRRHPEPTEPTRRRPTWLGRDSTGRVRHACGAGLMCLRGIGRSAEWRNRLASRSHLRRDGGNGSLAGGEEVNASQAGESCAVGRISPPARRSKIRRVTGRHAEGRDSKHPAAASDRKRPGECVSAAAEVDRRDRVNACRGGGGRGVWGEMARDGVALGA
jgi:hypothetical protein